MPAFGSASCDATHETGGTILLYWVLGFVISPTTQWKRFVTGHETGDTTCYRLWVLRFVISHTRQKVRFVTGVGFCVL